MNRFFTLSIVAVLLYACTARPVLQQMDRAGRLMEISPDSSLAILQAIPAGSVHGYPARARYSLLLSQALDKNFVNVESDSIIRPAQMYYKYFGSPREKFLARYYAARVEQNQDHKTTAIALFLSAEPYIIRCEDLFYTGLLYSSIAELYMSQEHYASAHKYYDKAYDCYLTLGRPDYLADVMVAMGFVYANTFDIKWATYFYLKALDISNIINDNNIKINSLRGLALSYYNENPELGLKYMDSLGMISKYTLKDSITLSAIYVNLGETGRAENIINSVASRVKKSDVQYVRIRRIIENISAETNDYKQAWICNEEYRRYNDSVNLQNLSHSVADKELELRRESTERSSVTAAWMLLVVLLIIFMGFIIFVILYKQKKEFKEHTLKEIIHSKFWFRNLLAEVLYTSTSEEQRMMKLEELIVEEFNRRIYYEMEQSVNAEYDDLFSRVTSAVSLTDRERKTFLLLCCNFSPRSIAVILNISIEAAYKSKSRLLQKVTGSKDVNLAEIEAAIGLK